jgi:hypothetical protein
VRKEQTVNVNEICAAIMKMDDLEKVRDFSQRVNAAIKARYNDLQRSKAYSMGVGSRVQFKDKRGNTVVGKITKINTKTVYVKADGSLTQWRVTPSLLQAA